MSAVPSALPSSTTMTSKSGVSFEAVWTVRITMLAMVPLSLYAGKKTRRPARLAGAAAGMEKDSKPYHVLPLHEPRSRRDEAPRRGRRFEEHAAGQLRNALAPLDERDRYFSDAKAGRRRRVEHLDEKRVAVGIEPFERERGDRLPAPAAVPARAVARREPRDGADVDIREAAEQPAPERPVHHLAAGHVAGADHQVGAIGGGDERRQMLRIVRQIAVHLADDIDRARQRAADAVDVRAAEP